MTRTLATIIALGIFVAGILVGIGIGVSAVKSADLNWANGIVQEACGK